MAASERVRALPVYRVRLAGDVSALVSVASMAEARRWARRTGRAVVDVARLRPLRVPASARVVRRLLGGGA